MSFPLRRGWVLAMVLTSTAWCAAAPPEAAVLPPVLSLAQALDLFREQGLDVLLAEADVQTASGDVASARAIANPGLTGNFGKSFACPSAGCRWLGPPLLGVGLSDSNALVDALSGKRSLRIGTAEAGLESARQARDDAERTLTSQLEQQFVQALLAQQAVGSVEEAVTAADQLLGLTRVRYRSGAISEADVARVETDAYEAAQALDTARLAARSAQLGVAFLLGVRSEVPDFRVEEPTLLHFAVPPGLAAPEVTPLIARALESRPDLRAAEAETARAETALRLARRSRFPDVGLSVQYVQQGTDPGAITPPTVTAGLTTSLPLFSQAQGEVQRADAEVRRRQLRLARVRAQIAEDVQGALASFDTSQRLARRMEGGLLDRARRARDLVTIQYQKGAASLLELLDAQRVFRAVSLEYQQDLVSYWSSVFKLEEAVGRTFR